MNTDLITTGAGTAIERIRPAAAYLAALRTDVSRAGMRSELNKVARLALAIAPTDARPDDWQRVDWRTLNASNIGAILARVDGKAATRNKTLAALRGVARQAYLAGAIDADTWQRIGLVKIEAVQRDDQTLEGRHVEDWEIAALMRTCAADPSAAGIRDAALIALAAKTGARRAELAGACLDGITAATHGYELRIVGKRGKVRTLYADNGAGHALADWLAVRGAAIGEDAPLFVNISQRGEIGARALSTTALDAILRKRCAAAGVQDCDWHDFRRTFAGKLLDAGEDISTVAQLMGHASVTTTARYDRRPAEARRKAARKISVPYFARKPAHP